MQKNSRVNIQRRKQNFCQFLKDLIIKTIIHGRKKFFLVEFSKILLKSAKSVWVNTRDLQPIRNSSMRYWKRKKFKKYNCFMKLRKFLRHTFWKPRKQFYSKGYLMRPKDGQSQIGARPLETSLHLTQVSRCVNVPGWGGRGYIKGLFL